MKRVSLPIALALLLAPLPPLASAQCDQEILSPVPTTDEQFGRGLDLYGTRCVISTVAGAVGPRIYRGELREKRWVIEPAPVVVGGQSRYAVAAGASFFVAGDALAATAGLADAGAARVYDWSGAPVQDLIASDPAREAKFGNSVATDGRTIAISAPGAYGLLGAVYLFEDQGSGWTEVAKLVSPDQHNNLFGGEVDSIDVDGGVVVVGAILETTGAAGGAAYVFRRAGGTWRFEQKLLASDGEDNDCFGAACAVSGDRIVVGAWRESHGEGAAYVYEHAAGVWTETQKLVPGGAPSVGYFGRFIDLDEDDLIVSYPYHGGTGTSTGAFIRYARRGAAFAETQRYQPAEAFTTFGGSVVISAGNVLGSAYHDFRGVVRAFTRGHCDVGTSYCGPGTANSTGRPGVLTMMGSDIAADGDVEITATGLPPLRFGYFLASRDQGFFMPPGSDGFLCLAGNIGRFDQPANVIRGPVGSIHIDLSAIPVNPVSAVLPGDTWNFQCWHRDFMLTNNFTDAVTVVFR